MFAQCPHCHTVFRITEQQLDVAGGTVRCGHCKEIFDAREYLSQEPPEPKSAPQADQAEDAWSAAAPEPQGLSEAELGFAEETAASADEPGEVDVEADEAQSLFDASAPEETEEIQADSLEGKPEPPEPQPMTPKSAPPEATDTQDSDAWGDEPLDEPPAEAAAEADRTVSSSEHGPTFDDLLAQAPQAAPGADAGNEPPPSTVADELEDQLLSGEQRRSIWPRLGWAGAVLGLMGLLLFQYAYFMRADLGANPTFRPWIERMCTAIGCDVPLPRDVAKLRLLSRDVSVHPEQAGLLRVQATMVNGASHAQPFPVIELRLFNTRGEVVAARQFEPTEYLDESFDQEAGMEPEQPVGFVLEVVKPDVNVMTYQFEFL